MRKRNISIPIRVTEKELSLTDNDDNKTAEEIEAEERARLAGENVAGVLEIARLVAEAITNQSDEPLEEPVLKM